MKKMLMTVSVWTILCTASYARYSVNRLFREFSETKGVEHVRLGKWLMGFVRCVGVDTGGVKQVDVFGFSGCDPAWKSRLENAACLLKDKDYEMVLSSNAENERVRILVKMTGGEIRDPVLPVTGDDPALIRLAGKIRPSDVERLLKTRK
ncbi:MAG: DUF4252 domain-containing protein [Tannerella sp.]|jgi:hypothetical protein|nr:DUF4252 domain-containing protein [Tannerella sp.]